MEIELNSADLPEKDEKFVNEVVDYAIVENIDDPTIHSILL